MLATSTTAEPEKIVPRASGSIGFRQLLPVHEVAADGVPPRHVAPFGVKGIVLEKQMVFALVEHQPVGVVGPSSLRRKVKLRAVLLLIAGASSARQNRAARPETVSKPNSLRFIRFHLTLRATMPPDLRLDPPGCSRSPSAAEDSADPIQSSPEGD